MQYHHFEEIWSLCERHMVKNLPSAYDFALGTCYEAEYNHPICQRGRRADELVLYTGGPSVQFLPLPVPDPKRPWRSKECKNCNGFCTGHFMYLEKVVATGSSDLPAAHTYPPNTVIKKSLKKAQKESRDLNSGDVEELAKQTNLSTEDDEMWVTHLDSVKKRRQAAATRKQKSARQKSNDKVATTGNEFGRSLWWSRVLY